jgi:predicted alpha/beta hydrolase
MTKSETASVEEIEIRTNDGWSLRADVHTPSSKPLGTAVLAHALMARRSEYYRPNGSGLARFLVARGWRVVAFDFRGHGDSGPGAHLGARYGYDELVERDLPAVCATARARVRGKAPLILIGHSLGGHAALAAQGTGAVDVRAVVGIAASPWLPQLEPSRSRWLIKRAVLRAGLALSRRVGRLPARALGRGSDDEALRCIEDFCRFASTGAWTSANGRVDYLAAMARVRTPVLAVVSDGDRLDCVPECGERLLARCGGRRDLLRVERRDDGGPPPGHMGLVTSARVADAWSRIEAWMRGV